MMGSEDVILDTNIKDHNAQTGTENAHTEISKNSRATPNGAVNELIVERSVGNGNEQKKSYENKIEIGSMMGTNIKVQIPNGIMNELIVERGIGNGNEQKKPYENKIEIAKCLGNASSNGVMNELIVERDIGNGNGNGQNKMENVFVDDEYTDGYSVRALEISDYKKGFVELIGQLSPTPPLSEEEFQARFAELASLGPDHHICVIEDPTSRRIVATGSVFLEKKFIRGCGKAGHIEDVVVDSKARGLRLGQRVIKHLVGHARAAGCYKVVLYCKPEVKEFYRKCGFVEKDVQMAIYF